MPCDGDTRVSTVCTPDGLLGWGVSQGCHTSCFGSELYVIYLVRGFIWNVTTIGQRFHMKCCYHWVGVSHEMLLPLGGGFTWNVATIGWGFHMKCCYHCVGVSHEMLLPLGGGFTWNVIIIGSGFSHEILLHFHISNLWKSPTCQGGGALLRAKNDHNIIVNMFVFADVPVFDQSFHLW